MNVAERLGTDRTRWCTECMWATTHVEAVYIVNLNDAPRMQRFACENHAVQYESKQALTDFWEEFDHLMLTNALKMDE